MKLSNKIRTTSGFVTGPQWDWIKVRRTIFKEYGNEVAVLESKLTRADALAEAVEFDWEIVVDAIDGEEWFDVKQAAIKQWKRQEDALAAYRENGCGECGGTKWVDDAGERVPCPACR